VFLGINVVSVTVNATLLSRTNLETIAERGRGITHMKGWDRAIAGVWSAAQYIAIPLVSGLDVRFGWTPELSSVDHVAGGVILASGLELMSWAMIVNAYFSTAARVQTERGQTVCRTGPYRVVRHPGYAGAIQQSLGTPFLLGSAWALIAAVVAVVAIVARTILEDRMLQAELPGYAAYAREVRYHLIPGIW
jgi:protein-S-isoprenylcysteine O-methyltransferase Ste14